MVKINLPITAYSEKNNFVEHIVIYATVIRTITCSFFFLLCSYLDGEPVPKFNFGYYKNTKFNYQDIS